MFTFFGADEPEKPALRADNVAISSRRSNSPSSKKSRSSTKNRNSLEQPLYISADLCNPSSSSAAVADPSRRSSSSPVEFPKKKIPVYTHADLPSSPYLQPSIDPSNPYSTNIAADGPSAFTYLDEGTFATPQLHPVPVELEMTTGSMFSSTGRKSVGSPPIDIDLSNYKGASIIYEERVEVRAASGRRSSIQKMQEDFYKEDVDLYYSTDDDIARRFYGGWTTLVRMIRMTGINPLGIKAFVPSSAITDVSMFPPTCIWFVVLFQIVAFFGLFSYFLISLYSDGRTKPFVSLNSNSGDCKEIPTSIIGTYMIDSKGYWQTSAKFSTQLNNFEARLYSIQYTSSNWNFIIDVIKAQVKELGAKAKKRDMAFNLVALASFASIYDAETDSSLGLPSDSGTMIFYSTADPSTIFDKSLYTVGSFLSSYDGVCTDIPQTATYDRITATTTIGVEYNYYDEVSVRALCNKTFSPELLGYEFKSYEFDLKINLNSIMTAMAVNLGIRKLESLVKIDGDIERIQLLRNLRDLGRIGNDVLEGTSTFYDELLAPMAPIYCTTFTDLNSTSGAGTGSQCVVRIGNALLYPIVHHVGYYDYVRYRYLMCTQKKVATSTDRKFGCNVFDIMVGLIYYGSDESVSYTAYNFETLSPTLAPSPQPGKPTRKPTLAPSPAPSVHSRRPSFSPTFMPSYIQSIYYDDSYGSYVVHNNVSYSAATYSALIEDDDLGTESTDDDYKRGLADDDYQQHPFHGKVIDTGEIFGLLRECAKIIYDDPVDGDLALMTRFYDLNYYSLGYNSYSSKNSTMYSEACSPNPNCRVISVEFYEPFNKKISTLLYQPSPTLAFTDIFYDVMSTNAFQNMKNPPTKLTQPYFSCVLEVGDAFNNALGVAKGNVDLYLSIGVTVLVFLIMASLNNIRRINPPIKSLSTVFAEKEMFDPEEELRQSVMRRQTEIEVLQVTVKSLQSKLDKLYEYNTELHDDIERLKMGQRKR